MTEKELNLLVADKIFGTVAPAPYTTDIAMAWDVFEYIRKSRWPTCSPIQASVEFKSHNGYAYWIVTFISWENKNNKYTASASTSSMAICKAALKTVGVEIE